MNIERTVLTNALLEEKIKTLTDVIDVMRELQSNQNENIRTVCQKHNLNPSKTRNFILYSTNIRPKDAPRITKKAAAIYLFPEEELYCDILNVGKSKIANMFLPADLKETLGFIISDALTPTERKVILLRYGITDNKINPNGYKHILDDIGKQCGFSKQCAQQLTSNAIKKLKNMKYKDLLTYGLAKVREAKTQTNIATFDKDILLAQQREYLHYSIRQSIQLQPYFRLLEELGLSVRLENCIKRAGNKGRFPQNPRAIDLMLTSANHFDSERGFGATCKEELLRVQEFLAKEIGCSSAIKASGVCRMLLDKYDVPRGDTNQSVAPALMEAIINKEIEIYESTGNHCSKPNNSHLMLMGDAAV